MTVRGKEGPETSRLKRPTDTGDRASVQTGVLSQGRQDDRSAVSPSCNQSQLGLVASELSQGIWSIFLQNLETTLLKAFTKAYKNAILKVLLTYSISFFLTVMPVIRMC